MPPTCRGYKRQWLILLTLSVPQIIKGHYKLKHTGVTEWFWPYLVVSGQVP